jgi:hypothetical protein
MDKMRGKQSPRLHRVNLVRCPLSKPNDNTHAESRADYEPHSSGDGFERSRLIRDRRAFSSRVRFLTLRGTRVGTRLAGR